jgi:hypothetical protein
MLPVLVATVASTLLVGSGVAIAATPTPGQLLASSGAAAKGEPSFHYVATESQSSLSITIAGDVAKTGGTQTIVANMDGQVGHVTVTLVEGSAYFRGDEPGLQNFMQLPAALATEYTNQWISLSKGDPGYPAIAAGLTTASALSQVEIAKPLTLKGMTTKMGQRVLTIGGTDRGTPSGSTKPVTIPVRLYVKASGAPLPVLYSATWVVAKHSQVQSVSFSHWKEPVHVTAPAGPVPMSALGGKPVEA